MIYNIDTIPYKLFLRIAETNDLQLLVVGSESIENEILEDIWKEMYEYHLENSETSETKKIFKISKEIEYLESNYKFVLMLCESLKFEYSEDVLGFLKEKGFQISTENTEKYHAGIDKVIRESESYLMKAEEYKAMLPTEKQNEDYNIDDTMALYSAILGFSIGDFNLLTYKTFKSYEKQVNQKIKSINEQKNK